MGTAKTMAKVPNFMVCNSMADCQALAKLSGFVVDEVINRDGNDLTMKRRFSVLSVKPPIGSLQPVGTHISIERPATPADLAVKDPDRFKDAGKVNRNH
ncbi:hypothetical protein [Pseudomonas sp. PLMAX]|uniref:hypothetical protein n=1 Tax=Pseudomonas sp. PLMAX TaxID=2201998 RepID=UPI0038BE10B6